MITPGNSEYDAVVVGAGPNGLAAGITLCREGLRVLILEGHANPGGGLRTEELTLPGFRHDVCSSIHPFGVMSPFLRSIPLESYGLRWIYPDVPLAHPVPDEDAAFVYRSVRRTCDELGIDGRGYARLMRGLVGPADALTADLLQPLPIPHHPIPLTRFGLKALRSASSVARAYFQTRRGRALFAGLAAHSMLPLERTASAAVPIVLALAAHRSGWPFPEGGAGELGRALVEHFIQLGGEIQLRHRVRSMDDLPKAHAYLFATDPRQLVDIAGHRFSDRYNRTIERFRFGPGVFKVDYALSAPIPWSDATCASAGTVHLGGTLEEIELSERTAFEGGHSTAPYVLLAQHSLFDGTRAPDNQHTAWAYCHVPSGSNRDMLPAIENQIERFAPGFSDIVLHHHTMTAREFERYNPNYVGGDINGGTQDLRQLFTRPAPRLDPYSTPDPAIFICSSSTPPGGGIHGMSGYNAARSVLSKLLR